MKKILNVEKIISMRIVKSHVSIEWFWHDRSPAKKFLFFTYEKSKPEGWYKSFQRVFDEPDRKVYTISEIVSKNEHLFANSEVLPKFQLWQKPKIEIKMLAGSSPDYHNIYFNTDEEAKEGAKKLSEQFPSIVIN